MSEVQKERPILFSAPMVQAILEGRKTMTRRVMKPQPVNVIQLIGRDNLPTDEYGLCLSFSRVIDKHARCPHGQPRDRLWVRETWNKTNPSGDIGYFFYRATDEDKYPDACWRPSIFMPRCASRILLEIIAVRAERLNDISGEDCIAEGIPKRTEINGGVPLNGDIWRDARKGFRSLWDTINFNGWDANPSVWVITFRRLKPCS